MTADEPMVTTKRIMALDLGDRRIGIAVSDERRRLARSLAVIERKSRAEDFATIARLVEELDVDTVVVGLPKSLSGREGRRATWARDYGQELAKAHGLTVAFWDESFSTLDAEESLRARGIRGKKRRERVDAVAAAFILQSYLDARYGTAGRIR